MTTATKLEQGVKVRHQGLIYRVIRLNPDGSVNLRSEMGMSLKQNIAVKEVEALNGDNLYVDEPPQAPVKPVAPATPAVPKLVIPPKPEPSAPLSEIEQSELVSCEQVIEAGLQTFYEVGSALASIRDNRLYRSEYSTYEEYCEKRWGITKTHANRQINAAQVITNLTPMGVILPANERQARPLAGLQPNQQKQVMEQAAEAAPDGKPTTATIEKAAQQIKAAGRSMDVHYLSESSERYSPPDFMQSVRDVLGVIDLDPASIAMANRVVEARRYFDIASDGLKQLWDAENVYLNPPYGTEITPWVARLISEYQRDAFPQAILLVPARTDTIWFGLLRVYPRCFVSGRLKFWNDNDPSLKNGAPFPSAAFYLGHEDARFAEVFSSLGDVYQLWMNR